MSAPVRRAYYPFALSLASLSVEPTATPSLDIAGALVEDEIAARIL
jgi:hypothetical protein